MAITVGRRSALTLLAGLPLLAAGTARAQPSLGPGVGVDPNRTPVRYTMTAFRTDSDTTLAVYESTDGTDFTPVREHAYSPPVGLVRDPSVLLHTDGHYYLTYTIAGDAGAIGLARSRDRIPGRSSATCRCWWWADSKARGHRSGTPTRRVGSASSCR
ncbi:hypothetical protein ACTWPB_20655 [Nocardia sp. IBHARD005]|uniref:hypothetical protein n=1 Tax=Nocardia sp. IBHARD005 TaxID=3457765 RepID=UPI0040586192